MRAFALVVLLCAGCPEKKKAVPPPAEPAAAGSSAPVLQPTEQKLDKAMDTNENRATPEPE